MHFAMVSRLSCLRSHCWGNFSGFSFLYENDTLETCKILQNCWYSCRLSSRKPVVQINIFTYLSVSVYYKCPWFTLPSEEGLLV